MVTKRGKKNSDSLCNRSDFIQVHFRLAMKICSYQLTQSHTRGELSEPDSTQRLLQSTEKRRNYYILFSKQVSFTHYYACGNTIIFIIINENRNKYQNFVYIMSVCDYDLIIITRLIYFTIK